VIDPLPDPAPRGASPARSEVRLLGFPAELACALARRLAAAVPEVAVVGPGPRAEGVALRAALVTLDGPGPSASERAELAAGDLAPVLVLGRGRPDPSRAERERGLPELPRAEAVPIAPDDLDAVCWALGRALDSARVERELEQAVARYELATEANRDGLFDWDRGTGRVFWSPLFEAMLGLERGSLAPRLEAWLERVHPSEQATVRCRLDQFLAGPSPTFQVEVRVRHATRGYRLMRLRGQALLSDGGGVQRLVGSQRDVTSARQREERLRYAASHDPLTGVANRARFHDRLEHALELAARRPGAGCSVLMVDLDDFKPVNDLYGHAAGDALLVEVARRMRACVRPADTVARLGGDEFAILLEGLGDQKSAQAIAERLVAAVAEPHEFEGHRLSCGASVGIVLADGSVDDAEELLDRADRAMYAAKQQGGGVVALRPSRGPDDDRDTLFPMPLPPRPRELCARPLVELLSRVPVGFELAGIDLDGRPRPLEPGDVERLSDALEPRPARLDRVRWVDLCLNSACVRSASALAVTERGLSLLRRFAIQVRVGLSEDAFVQGGEEFFAGVDRLRAGGALVLVDNFGRRHGPLACLSSGRADGLRLSPNAFGGDEQSFESVASLALGSGAELVASGVGDEFQALRCMAAGVALAAGPLFGPPLDPVAALASEELPGETRVARSLRRR
jgi:diguanylate cyclase (GGDEF)-like protein/PAS domain S-box-containing protein